jgi:preprotein translocase subunit YajC
MFISTAYAQAAGGGGSFDFLGGMLPLILIFVIFWFFLIRPQQRKQKEHRAMVQNLKRNDQVITAGGILGKVTRLIDDNTVQVEIADNVRVRVARGTITEVLTKTAPRAAKASDEKSDGKETAEPEEGGEKAETADEAGAESGGRKSLFSFGSKK